jgi:hypothetical protein
MVATDVSMDNWFTSLGVADELLLASYNLTLVGTLRKNKAEIPPDMLETRQRQPGTSVFCFDKQKTLVKYLSKTKNKKLVILLSTIHTDRSLNKVTKKPEMIHFYNETKFGVDTFDQMCSNMNCCRKTRRWPMCVFYDLINIAAINSFVIYNSNRNRRAEKSVSRMTFMLNLKDELVIPWLQLLINTLHRPIRQDICNILNIDMVHERPVEVEKKRTICAFCPSRLRRMTTNYCNRRCQIAARIEGFKILSAKLQRAVSLGLNNLM